MKLTNKGTSPFTINLPRGTQFGADYAPKMYTQITTERGADGSVGMKHKDVDLPASIVLLPKETKEVPDGIEKLGPVSRALRDGTLKKGLARTLT